MIFQKIKNFVLDILFPVSCLFCSNFGAWICRECLEKIEILKQQVCPYCENCATSNGIVCFGCKSKFFKKNKTIPLDGLLVSARYRDTKISRAVHTFKYNFIKSLRVPLGSLIVESTLKNDTKLPDMIIPVPLHNRRLRWRGFNQAELLACYVGKNLSPGFDIPVFSNILTRNKYTSPQMKIKNYAERKKNIQNSFNISRALANKNILKEKTILLVDDISTTGATLFECARVLKQNGARKVFGAVIARQEYKK